MKNDTHHVEITIDASPEAVWKVIGSGKDVDKWLAPITSCSVEGNKRVCGTDDGSFEEDIQAVDHDKRVFNYTIPSQHMIPVQDIKSQMEVRSAEGHKSTVRWSWSYHVEDENVNAAKEAFSMIGDMGIHGIEKFANSMS